MTVATAVADKPEPVGDRITVYPPGPDTFPAGVPFHITHGWRNDPFWGLPIGLFDFQLEIDGVYWDEDFFTTEPVPGGKPQEILRMWYNNFPEGMQTGEVYFTGHWPAQCQAAADYHYYPVPCEEPNEIVEPYTDPLAATFYEEWAARPAGCTADHGMAMAGSPHPAAHHDPRPALRLSHGRQPPQNPRTAQCPRTG